MSAGDRGDASVDRGGPSEAARPGRLPDPQRRRLLSAGPKLLMLGGLIGGYGTFFAMAGRFLFPSDRNKAWVFVREVTGIAPGKSLSFVSPTGLQVTITRRASDATDPSPTVEEFLALSSVCPHLGCAVDFNNKAGDLECPCHASAFAKDGAKLIGPSLRGLDPLEVKLVKNGDETEIWVENARFRTGVAERILVG